jgi:beta-carotene 3-hydroxylase
LGIADWQSRREKVILGLGAFMSEIWFNVLSIFYIIAAFLGTAIFWEIVAYWMHKHVMHGIGWFLHEDHHKTSGRRLQRNDAYAIFFAICSFLLIFNGLKFGLRPMAASGFGVALYGLGYVIFHDIMFHRRIKWIRYKPGTTYMKRIIDNHRVHHGTTTKHGAVSFGFLWAPRPIEKPTGEIPDELRQ